MQQSGGLLPARARPSRTLIFAFGKNANESPAGTAESCRRIDRAFIQYAPLPHTTPPSCLRQATSPYTGEAFSGRRGRRPLHFFFPQQEMQTNRPRIQSFRQKSKIFATSLCTREAFVRCRNSVRCGPPQRNTFSNML